MAGFQETLKATGTLNVRHLGPEGNLINEYNFTNLVVTGGLQFIAARLVETGRPTQMTHMGVGISSTSPVLGNTGLGTALGARVALNVAGGVASGTKVTYAAVFGPNAQYAGNIVEAGIFNALTSGTMLCRTTFNPIGLTAADSLAISWEITIS